MVMMVIDREIRRNEGKGGVAAMNRTINEKRKPRIPSREGKMPIS